MAHKHYGRRDGQSVGYCSVMYDNVTVHSIHKRHGETTQRGIFYLDGCVLPVYQFGLPFSADQWFATRNRPAPSLSSRIAR